jgi:Kef-type K+ transport system membrane component KefB
MGPAVLAESGLAVLAALAAGAAVKKLRLPKVTGYIVAGLLLGPSVVGLLSAGDLGALEIVQRLALGLIMFRLGREFAAGPFRKLGRRVVITVCCVVGVTFGVTLAVMAAAGAGTTAAVLLAVIAVTTSPAAVVLVVREYDSEGPLTDVLLSVVALGNVIGLVLFDLTLPLVAGRPAAVLAVLGGVAGSVVFGAVLGLVLGAYERISSSPGELIAVTVAMLLVAIGAARLERLKELDPLIAAIVFGATYANASTRGAQVFDRITRVDMVVYCLFFVMAGAAIDFAAVRSVSVLVGPYIVARIAGIVFGSMLGTRLTGQRRDVRLYLGWALLPTGGVAIGVAHALSVGRLGGASMAPVVALALGSVAFFELIGPLAVKFAIVRVGEVKLISLVAEHGAFQALAAAVGQVRRALGIPSYRTLPLLRVTARHVMRTHVETLAQNARLPDIMRAMAHSGYDLLPVVDNEGRLHGGITLSSIRSVTFDPVLANLVIARDLASSSFPVVYEEDTLSDVIGKFADQPGELAALPVVDAGDHTHLIGMVNQREVLDAVHLVERTRRARAARPKQGDAHDD